MKPGDIVLHERVGVSMITRLYSGGERGMLVRVLPFDPPYEIDRARDPFKHELPAEPLWKCRPIERPLYKHITLAHEFARRIDEWKRIDAG